MTVGTWAVCPSCGRERRTRLGRLTDHRAWFPQHQAMRPCHGSGSAAAPSGPEFSG